MNPSECPLCGGEVEFLAYGKKDATGQIVEVHWCWNCDLPIEGAPASQEKFDEQYQKAQEERAALKDSVLAGEILGTCASTISRWLKENHYRKVIMYVRDEEKAS